MSRRSLAPMMDTVLASIRDHRLLFLYFESTVDLDMDDTASFVALTMLDMPVLHSVDR